MSLHKKDGRGFSAEPLAPILHLMLVLSGSYHVSLESFGFLFVSSENYFLTLMLPVAI